MTDWKNTQNRDGGWAYSKGCSWTEPTALVLLAQSVTQIDRPVFEAGLKFLYSTQRGDGGWSPQPAVAESTWVTALAALLPEEAIGAGRLQQALVWLEGQTGKESSWSFRLQQRLAGTGGGKSPDGFPWFPGAAAWVIPTSLGILAFQRALRRAENRAFQNRVNSGWEFLAIRVCADGGWNHGGNHAMGRDSESYPETTGIALAALRGASDGRLIERGKTAARRHLVSCRSAEGIAWLRIGLAAHGEFAQSTFTPTARTNVDAALTVIAGVAPDKNPFFV